MEISQLVIHTFLHLSKIEIRIFIKIIAKCINTILLSRKLFTIKVLHAFLIVDSCREKVTPDHTHNITKCINT
jgi:hypothetical protein